MRIRIVTVGSYGDVRPYLALARGLSARGHEVRLLGPDFFERYAVPAGVTFEGLGPHTDEDEIKRTLTALAAEPDEQKHPEVILRNTRDSNLAMSERAIELTRDADLVVAHNLSLLGYLAAKVNQKKFVTGHLFPCLIPSSRLWLTGRNFGPIINRLLWKVAKGILARGTDPFYAEIFSKFGLPPQKDVMAVSGHSPLSNLVAISPRVVARDPAWAAHYECTGYWNLPEDAYEPDPALRAFVEDGDPPIVVTFGSMFGVDAAALTRLLLEVLSKCGRRVVLQAGWAGIGEGELPDNVRRAEFVSHNWLMPRAACVVHHGGAGTTGAVLRAGKPHVIAFHLGDQQFWCRHLMRLGLCAGGIANRKLTAPWLASTLRRALDDKPLGERTAALGAELRAEDGVGKAALAIERVAAA